jgi:hypothetical protein
MSIFAQNFYYANYLTKCNVFTAQLVNGTYYPASASFIDCSPFVRCGFLITTEACADASVIMRPYQDTSATVTGSVKVINATYATMTLVATNLHFIEWGTRVMDIQSGFKYATLYLVSGAAGVDYASILFFGWGAKDLPVTQTATFPAANSAKYLVGTP